MAYQNGSAADVVNLVNKISAFAQQQGWVLDNDNGRGDHCLHTGPNYVRLIGNLRNQYGPWVYAYHGTGYDGAGGLTLQSGATACNLVATPIAEYHLFVTSQYIHCAFFCGNGTWNNLMCGVLTKTCDFDGGTYVAGTNHSLQADGSDANHSSNAYWSRHSYPFDSNSSIYRSHYGAGQYTRVNAVRSALSPDMKNFSFYNNSSDDVRGCGGYTVFGFNNAGAISGRTSHYSGQAVLMARASNLFNGLSIMHPIMVGVHYQAGYMTTLGHPQDLRLVNLKYLQPKDILTVGTDEWIVFPAKSRHLISPTLPYSEYIGYAYLRNA